MLKKSIMIMVLALFVAPNASFCGGIPVFDAISNKQQLVSYLKDLEEYLEIINIRWATVEKYRKELQKDIRKAREYERMIKSAQRIEELLKEGKWKAAAKRSRRLYDWGMDEFFDKKRKEPSDVDEILGKFFYKPKDPDEAIVEVENVGIDSKRTEREIELNFEDFEAIKRQILFATGTQSESDGRREDLFPKMKDMVEDADGESAESLLKVTAQQNLILMEQIQDLIDQQTQAALNAENERMRRASESAQFIDYETKRLDNRRSRTFSWDDDRISGDL